METPIRALRRTAFAALAGALLVGGAAATPASWSPGPAAVAQLVRGQVYIEVLGEPNSQAGVIHAAIDIAAPREAVWRVMTDCARTGTIMRNATCRVVSGDMRSGSDVRVQTMGGNLIFPTMQNQVRTTYEPYSRMRFQRTGGDFRTLEGEWRLEPLNNGVATRVIYVNRLAVNLSVPAPLMRQGLRRDVPKMLLNLRRESLAAAR